MKLIIDTRDEYFYKSKVYIQFVKNEKRNLIGFINEITIYKR